MEHFLDSFLEGEPASEASDLYAVEVMAYELFAGRHPFDTTSLAALLLDIQTSTPDVEALALADEVKQDTLAHKFSPAAGKQEN